MTKTLTEQWREGMLPRGAYYVNRLNEIRIYFVTYEDNKYTHEIYEVLSPVPSYEQYIGLMDDSKELDKAYDKINLLEKRLAIATKALEDIRDWDEYDCMGLAKKALKEMEGVK